SPERLGMSADTAPLQAPVRGCTVPVPPYRCRRDDRTAATQSANSAITTTQAHDERGPDNSVKIATKPTNATTINTA
ncbi:MAG: hypothetical protein ACXV5Q_16505, partial [Frankiaceae bacterium]